MSGNHVQGNYGIDHNSYFSAMNTHKKNLINCEHVDCNSSSETQHQNEDAVGNCSKFGCALSGNNLSDITKWPEVCTARDFLRHSGSAPTRSFPYPLKRPKVYATRDFPDRCGALVSQINVGGSEDYTKIVTAEHSNGANCVSDMPTKIFRSMPVKSLASYYKNYVRELTCKEEEGKKTLKRLKKREGHASAKSVDGCNDAVAGSNEEPKNNLNANELANLSAVRHGVALEAKDKVKEVLNLFWELYNELLDEHRTERKEKGTDNLRFDVKAADRLKKKGKWIHSVTHFGHIPGIAIGDQFHFRAELAVVGLHRQYISGIDYVVLDGKMFARSIVDSGRYENKAKTVDVLIYSGQGGQLKRDNRADQKLERGNLALVNSMNKEYPIRVVKKSPKACNTSVMGDRWELQYTYDGLYVVKRFWPEKDHGNLVFKFELHRMPDQHRLYHQSVGGSRKLKFKECCVVQDVSQGKESMAIRAMNGIDDEKPQTFAYTTNMIYPEWHKQIVCRGCNCTNGCSNSEPCLCALKNGGEIPFSERGGILRPKVIVYECGPSCKCPPTCMNRSSQRGLRYKLELYKTESGGWAVRSPSYISSGGFVCEYVGKLQQIKQAQEKFDDNQGRFSGYRIDATEWGNVGRFISHSSSPNLFVQRILYDHEDVSVPHIMLFAVKNIPPLQELSCDYINHKMDQICGRHYQLKL